MMCPHCNAEVFVGNVLVRCLRCLRDIDRERIPKQPIKLNQKDEINTSEVSTVGFMEKPLDKDLDKHFTRVVLMLAEGTIPDYGLTSRFEVKRFEDFLAKNKITYNKTVIFSSMPEPSCLFSLPEEE